MKIRNAEEKDLVAIHTINQDNVPHVGSVDINWMKLYLDRSFYFKVIEDKNTIAGFVIAMLPTTPYESENFLWFKKNYSSFVYVDRIAIDKNYVGKGLGKKLYEDVERSMKMTSKLLTCEVNIEPPNPTSLAFHKKLGFQVLGHLDTKGGKVKVALLGKTV